MRYQPWPVLALVLALTASTQAQEPAPVIDARGPLHGATYQSLIAPPFQEIRAGLAPGGIFRLFGSHLGPEELIVGVSPFSLRLPDAEGGTEVHVRSIGSGRVAQASLIFVQQNELAAILPANFPIGAAEVRVWYQGRVSEPAATPVAFSFPGLFTQQQNGHGRAIVQHVEPDGSLTLNRLTNSARPGQTVTLWATGLGQARKDDTRVYIGEDFYPVEYAGPAPGLPGVDQINLKLHETLPDRGCYVRIVPAGDGLGTGPASIAVSEGGGPCGHPWGLSGERMSEIENGELATLIELSLNDQPSSPSTFAQAGGQAYALDEAELEIRATADARNELAYQPPYCFAYRNRIDPIPPFPEPPPPGLLQTLPPEETLTGNPWQLSGPNGETMELGQQAVSYPADVLQADPRQAGFFAPGEWTLRTPGGSAVGPLEATLRVPSLPDVAPPAALRRGEDFELSWPAEQTGPRDRARVQVMFEEPIPDAPESHFLVTLDCASEPGAASLPVLLSRVEGTLPGVSEGVLRFRFEHRQALDTSGAVDYLAVTANIIESWSIPLE